VGDNAHDDCHLVGRERELESLTGSFDPGTSTSALVFTGAPGIGKTALWEAGLRIAEESGFRVLAARPSEAEAQQPLAAIFDLLESVGADILGELPVPQRRALEAALLRAEPVDAGPEPFALGVGLLGVLRSLAARTPLVLAIDDLHWLDRASADALVFAARRLHGPACRLLLARRSGPKTEVEQALGPAGILHREVGPLSLEGTYRLLTRRFGLAMPPRTLKGLFEASQGIPLLVLELGEMLASQDTTVDVGELSVAELSGNPFRARVANLAPQARRALLAVSVSDHLSLNVLQRVADAAAIDNLIVAGLLVVDGRRVRPAHPLLALAIRKLSTAEDRRALHVLLAGSVADETLRARHLALATGRPDAGLAGLIAAAAEAAHRRGAAHDAADLAEHALRLTPQAAPDLPSRLLALAEHLVRIGELARAKELLAPRIGDFPPGAARARVHLLLAEAGNLTEHERHLELALAESEDEPELRAMALAAKSVLLSVIRLERVDVAQACAEDAQVLATSHGAPLARQVLQALAWVRVMRGLPLDDLVVLSSPRDDVSLYENSIDRQLGVRLVFRGQVAEARAVFRRLSALADERGEARFRAAIQIQLSEVELRAGRVTECARLVDQQREWAALDDLDANWARCQALLAAVKGSPQHTDRWGAHVTAMVASSDEDPGLLWDELEVRRARGIAALLTRRPDQAAEFLGMVWEYTGRVGIADPGAFPVAPDLVEALIGLGRIGEAAAVTDRLRVLAESQRHPWALATADRCAAAIALASGYDEDAAASLAAAAAALGELGLGFDQARSLLWLGQTARRARKRSAARHYLDAAAAAFAELGCDGWAVRARAELACLGGTRGPASGTLTPAQHRVAVLAADGLSNKQIARRLFIAEHTVEVHLARAYSKLGVRSRTQLANHLARSPHPGTED
jgi:DNA-binding CsgD family transcriptional regulator